MRDDLRWTRSTKCGSNACMEAAPAGDMVLLRDSKNPDRAPLQFSRAEWDGFLDAITTGDLAL